MLRLFLEIRLDLGLGLGLGLVLGLGLGLGLCLGLGLGMVLGKSLSAGKGALNDKKSKCIINFQCLEPPTEMFMVQPMGSLRFKIR